MESADRTNFSLFGDIVLSDLGDVLCHPRKRHPGSVCRPPLRLPLELLGYCSQRGCFHRDNLLRIYGQLSLRVTWQCCAYCRDGCTEPCLRLLTISASRIMLQTCGAAIKLHASYASTLCSPCSASMPKLRQMVAQQGAAVHHSTRLREDMQEACRA